MTVQSPNLRPLSAGEILDRAFRLYRANFWLFIGIAGVLLGPLLILELLSRLIFHDIRIVSYIQSFLTIYLLDGAMVWAASSAYLGLPVLINDSYRQAQRYFRPFFGAYFRQGLAYVPVVILAAVGAVVLSLGGVNEALGLSFLMLLVIPYILFFSTRWGLMVPAIIIENLDGRRGLTRSWLLTSKDFWRVFVVLIASSLLSYLAVSLPALIITYAMQLFEPVRMIGPSLSSIITQLGALISIPLSMSILVILYYDLRVRREAYDLELVLEATEEESDISNEQDLPDSE